MTPKEAEAFLGLQPGAFAHIPSYALPGALAAIKKVKDLEEKKIFRPGLYYIALTDLTASTEASKRLGAKLNQQRIEAFVTATVEALGVIQLRSYAQFVKEIGDATLFVFSSFEDLHDWWKASQTTLIDYNDEFLHSGDIEEEEWPYFELTSKSVVHLGEVAYSDGSRPVAAAVNQVFKIEKMFGPGQLGVTDAVRQAAAQLMIDRRLDVTTHGAATLPGDESETPLWLIDTTEKKPAEL
jgi:class 3 adenylate cyclase